MTTDPPADDDEFTWEEVSAAYEAEYGQRYHAALQLAHHELYAFVLASGGTSDEAAAAGRQASLSIGRLAMNAARRAAAGRGGDIATPQDN